MRKRSFLALFAATIVLVAAAVYAIVGGGRGLTPAEHERPAFPGLASHLGDLAWMRVVHGAMKADFNAIGENWVVVEKSNYPAAPGRVRRLLLGLADLALVEPKTRRPELYGRLGLDDPANGKSTSITVQDRTGKKVAEILVGKTRRDRLGGGNDGVYVRKPGDARTWLARGSLDLPGDIVRWLDRRIIDIPQSDVRSVTLTASDGTALVLRRDKPGDNFAVADAPADTKFKGPVALAAPAGALAGLDLDDVKPAVDSPVPTTGVATAAFTTFDELTINLRLFTAGGVDWVALWATGDRADEKAEADSRDINEKTERWLYAISAARAKLLRTKLADLVAPAKGS